MMILKKNIADNCLVLLIDPSEQRRIPEHAQAQRVRQPPNVRVEKAERLEQNLVAREKHTYIHTHTHTGQK